MSFDIEESQAYNVLKILKLSEDESMGLLAGLMDNMESMTPGYIANLTMAIVEARLIMNNSDE